VSDSNIFISSCSRRELARRRVSRPRGAHPTRALQLLVAALLLLAAYGAFVVGRGGL
jgi:hypothetical protein